MTAAAKELSDWGVRRCLLGVDRSLSGKRWEHRLRDPRAALALSQRWQLPDLLAQVLSARGVGLDEVSGYLEPTLKEMLPDPAHLLDMERAVERILAALGAGENIAVLGDYDVDGATSAALLIRFLRALGVPCGSYVPDRIKEGYGPNRAAFEKLHRQGINLVITVDCGISAHEPLAYARDLGLSVIVIDHHAAQPELPPADAIVNPNRQDETSAHGNLAAVGVTFLLLVALNRALRESGYYAAENRAEPDLRLFLDLVALGTVCDVVALTGCNRALVSQGLKVMAALRNPGLAALAQSAGLTGRPEAYHLGFLFGPRVNAGGRIGASDLGTKLLSSDDKAETERLAQRLEILNKERQDIEARVLEEALAQVEEQGIVADSLVFVAREGWHPGVIGIVAGRLRERFNLPAIVVALDGESGQGQGSGRSVPGMDLGNAVIAARQAGLLLKGGGHAMAAGLTVAAENLTELRAFLADRTRMRLSEIGYRPVLGLDGIVQPRGASAELIDLLAQCAPFGAGNPQPRFAMPGVTIVRADMVGSNHIRCILRGEDGKSLKGIAFRALDTDLGRALQDRRGRALHLAGRLQVDNWAQGNAVQLVIEDAALPEKTGLSHGAPP